KGLGVTFSTAARRPVTVKYPETKHLLPVRQRSFPVLTWDFDHDEPFCTGCNVCVRNCPVDCMTATMQDNPAYAAGTSNRRKIVEKFWIDYARCMRCNICVEVCPFEAIVMDNNWSGHEHSVYDRRDLHIDIDGLLHGSKSGELTTPFRPLDSIELLEKQAKGEEPPELSFKGARPEARQAMLDRIAQGLPAALQEREPEKPKAGAVSAAAAAATAGGEVEILSESKIRAKRMRAEREAKAYTDRGEPVPPEITANIEKYRNMKPGEAATALSSPGSTTTVRCASRRALAMARRATPIRPKKSAPAACAPNARSTHSPPPANRSPMMSQRPSTTWAATSPRAARSGRRLAAAPAEQPPPHRALPSPAPTPMARCASRPASVMAAR